MLNLNAGPINITVDPEEYGDTTIDGHCLPMQAKDMNSGSLAEFEAEQGSLPEFDLDHLDDILYKESIKYRVAKDTIFQKNSLGEHVTNLRILLLKGLTEGSGINNLEKKIMQEGDDFSSQELDMFNDELQKYVTISSAQTKQWLKGKTYSPGDVEDYFRMSEINPDLTKIGESIKEEGAFHRAYRDFVDARSVLRRLVKSGFRYKIKGKSPELTTDRKKPNHGRFAEEVELIHSLYFRENERRGLIRLDDVRHYNPRSKNNDQIRENVKLVQGKNKLPKMNPNELLSRLHIFDVALNDLVISYVQLEMGVKHSSVVPFIYTNLISNSSVEKELIGINQRTEKEFFKRFGGNVDMFQHLDVFTEALDTGKIDAYKKAEEGTAKKLIDVVQEYRNGVYKSFHSLRHLAMQNHLQLLNYNFPLREKKRIKMNFQELRDARLDVFMTYSKLSQKGYKFKKKELKMMKKQLRQNSLKQKEIIDHYKEHYGYVDETKMFPATYATQLGENVPASFSTGPYNSLNIQEAQIHAAKNGVHLFTKEEVKKVLASKGIEEALKFYSPMNQFVPQIKFI